jgi:hypothetical protein
MGKPDDLYIIVERAYINVLKFYSGFAKEALSDPQPGYLYIPGIEKWVICWISKFMHLSEQYHNIQDFDTLGLRNVAILYQAAQQLDYERLVAKTWNHLRHSVRKEGCKHINISDMTYICENIPAFVDVIAQAMIDSHKVTDPQEDVAPEYIHEILTGKTKLAALLYPVVELKLQELQERQQARREQKAREAAHKLRSMACHHCSQLGHLRKNCPVAAAQMRANVAKQSAARSMKCYNCHKTGHLARNCRFAPKNHKDRGINNGGYKGGYRGGQQVQPSPNGHGLTTCDRVLRPGQKARLGLTV